MPIISQRSELPEDQRVKLRVLLKEAEERGLPIAEKLRARLLEKTREWELDENGYFVRRDGHKYVPYEEAKKFLESQSRFLLMLGARGSGKTAVGGQKALGKIEQGKSGAVFNPHFENFKTSTWAEFREWIPWNHVIPSHRYRAEVSWTPEKPFTLAFENGATVFCKGLKDESSARGPNINWLWYDEAQDDDSGMGWKIAIASVRIGEKPQAWCTATGRGTYHWMYEFFVEQAFTPEVLEMMQEIKDDFGEDIPLIDWFHGTIEDNKNNLDPGFYMSMITAYPEGFLRDQEIKGLFADPGGQLGDPKWFDGKRLPKPPNTVKKRIWYWDLAASEKKISGPSGKKLTDPDETVGTLLSWWEEDGDDRFCIENQISGTWKWETIKEKIKDTVSITGPFIPIYVEQEPGSGGINQLAALFEYLETELPGWTFVEHNPRDQGDKIMRANIWFAEATLGKFYMVQGNWNESFLKQLASFPSGKHDDKIDSVSGARLNIAPIRRWRKAEFLHLGMKIEDNKKKEIEETVV